MYVALYLALLCLSVEMELKTVENFEFLCGVFV